MKQALIDYNRQDCEALELVTNRLIDLHRKARPSRSRSGPHVRDEVGKPVPLRSQRVRAAGNGDHQQGRLLGLPARARLCEVGQKKVPRRSAPSYAPRQTKAKHHDRIPGCFALSSVQIREALQPWHEEQDRHRPSIYAVRNKALGGALHDPSATMPIMWNHLQIVRSSLDHRKIRFESHRVHNVPKH